jgi:hypothetical protein
MESINDVKSLDLGHGYHELGQVPRTGPLVIPDSGEYSACSSFVRLARPAQDYSATSSGLLSHYPRLSEVSFPLREHHGGSRQVEHLLIGESQVI